MWVCPKCGRRFRNRNQWHSCTRYKIEDHFHGKPEKMAQLFKQLLERLKPLGSINVDAVKTEITLGSLSHFASVNVRRKWLNVDFLLDRVINDRRIAKVTEITGTNFEHRVRLSEMTEIDRHLIGWLKESYLPHSR